MPIPKISGKNVPTIPQIIAAINGRYDRSLTELLAKALMKRSDTMKTIAINEKIGPSMRKIGIISPRAGTVCERLNMLSVAPKRDWLKALALIDAMKIGAMARKEKCLRIAS
jgi:hypothetical protein